MYNIDNYILRHPSTRHSRFYCHEDERRKNVAKKNGHKKSLIVEGVERHKRHRHVTFLPTKRQVTDEDEVELTKIELELEEAPDNNKEQDRIPILVGSMPEFDPTAEAVNTTTYPHGFPGSPGAVVVRAEEALIVVFVLVLWIAAIALFFNRWGKIRMLEPYQPKFQQQHRTSCAVAETTSMPLRTSSKFNIHCLEHPLIYPCGQSQRPRQNSVFVGSSVSLLANDESTIPRRTKSAFDLQSLVLAECMVMNNPASQQHERITMEDDESRIEGGDSLACSRMVHSSSNRRLLKPCSNDFPKASRSFQRERGASICHFDRTDVFPRRPLQRERGMSICHFDRMDVLARPLQLRDRGASICHFDRMDVLARPICHRGGSRASIVSNFENFGKTHQRDSRTSIIFNNSIDKSTIIGSGIDNFQQRLNVTSLGRSDSTARFFQRDSRASLGSNERGMMVENLGDGKNWTSAGQSAGNLGIGSIRERGNLSSSPSSSYDRPSCSKTPDLVLGYEATCV